MPKPLNPQHRKFPFGSGVMVVSDRHLCGGAEGLVTALVDAMAAGAAAVQIRERDLKDPDYARLALQVCQRRIGGAAVLLNRRPHLVAPLGADGVQIGVAELPMIAQTRAAMPTGSLVGVSCHSEDDVQNAFLAGADYLVVGPLFPTASKSGATDFISIRDLVTWQQRYPLPIYPIGGIGVAQMSLLQEAGISRCACMRAILGATTSGARTIQTRALLYGLGL